MALLYIGAGAFHFIDPDFYNGLMPDWLPEHYLLIKISGVSEILLGILLLPGSTRRASSLLLIAMLIVFFFVIHIPMTIHFYGKDNLWFAISVLRLPIQYILVRWAGKYVKRYPKIMQT